MGDLGQVAHVHVLAQGHAPAVDLQDIQAPVAVGDGDGDLPVEPPRPPKRRVQGIGDVGGGNDNDVLALVKTVHQGQEGGHHPLLHVADDIFPPGGDGIDLVDEDDAGSLASGLLKDLAQVGLGLAIELVHYLRAAHREKVGLGLVGDGAGDEGLAAAGGAVEQHPFGRVDSQALEQLGVAQW